MQADLKTSDSIKKCIYNFKKIIQIPLKISLIHNDNDHRNIISNSHSNLKISVQT